MLLVEKLKTRIVTRVEETILNVSGCFFRDKVDQLLLNIKGKIHTDKRINVNEVVSTGVI